MADVDFVAPLLSLAAGATVFQYVGAMLAPALPAAAVMVAESIEYARLAHLVSSELLPAMVVDLDVFDENASRMAAHARAHNKTIRLATKSVRVPALIGRCLSQFADVFKGLMCFSVHEALFLAGIVPEARDFLIAYPCVQRADVLAAMELMTAYNSHVTLMVDSIAHVQLLAELWLECGGGSEHKLSLCVDVDMSYCVIPGLHVGVHRQAQHLAMIS